jgi:hypothetical protein
MYRAALLSLLVLASIALGDEPVANPKSECEQLLGALLPFAEKMLSKHGEFFPYGGTMDAAGKINFSAADNGTEHPPSATLIDMLKADFIDGATHGKYKATALVYDVRVVVPSTGLKSDAIAIDLDHRDDYSIRVYIPYRLDGGKLVLDTLVAEKGAGQIFAKHGG